MTIWKLLKQSLVFYRRSHLWIILGTAIGTAVLVGSLIIGDSVGLSLDRIVDQRLGSSQFVLSSGDRLFREQLCADMSGNLDVPIVPMLQSTGMAIGSGGKIRVNRVQILGVDHRFDEPGSSERLFNSIATDEAVINRALADRLEVGEGDQFLIRFKKIDPLPKDTPLTAVDEFSGAIRVTVKAIASDNNRGRFNLKAEQTAPNNVFLSRENLARILEKEGRINTLLIPQNGNGSLNLKIISDSFHSNWTIADAGLKAGFLHGRTITELKSERIFIDRQISDTITENFPDSRPIFTYFVNAMRLENRATPYSFVSAPGLPIVPDRMPDDEIIINDWLAEDIGAAVGDTIELSYYVFGSKRELIEKKTNFRVFQVVPLEADYLAPDLMPDFPGLIEEENCRDWDLGIPLDLDLIREKDEEYWDDYRGCPKAFITLATTQRLWGNRFGELTAVRFQNSQKEEIETTLRQKLDPVELGLTFRDVRTEGLLSSSESVDFSGLFLGLSFFIILAALMLTALLYVFNLEHRSNETGLMLALGFRKKLLKRFQLLEGAVLVSLGSLLGVGAGILFTQAILTALRTVWRGAVGTAALNIYIRPGTLIFGLSLGILAALSAIWLVSNRLNRRSITDLQRGRTKLAPIRHKQPVISIIVTAVATIAVVAILLVSDITAGREAFSLYFSAGTLLLILGISSVNIWLNRQSGRSELSRFNLITIGLRNNTRRRWRSLTLIGLLASGLFIVFTVGANRNSALTNAQNRESGTGGFALYGESTIPVVQNLNSKAVQKSLGFEPPEGQTIRFVQFRVLEGDDASCLNLNRVAQPQLIATNPAELSSRAAFSFAKLADNVDRDDPWTILDRKLPDGSIPAVADLTVIIWGLGKAVGDTLTYTDERGQPFTIKLVAGLANSIFQGNIIISEQALLEKFPSHSGYNMFLVEVPFDQQQQTRESVGWALQDSGLDLTPAAERLAEFNRVENTYLAIFLILGSFGLLLGSLGIAVVISRNIRDRLGELALMKAVGFGRHSIRSMLIYEHAFLIITAIFIGVCAALWATLPTLLSPGTTIPAVTILLLLAAVSANAAFWTIFACRGVEGADLLSALRLE